jgi:hypothetical protein
MAGRASTYMKVLKRDKVFLFEALFYLGKSRFLVATRPFKKIVPILGLPDLETNSQTKEEDRQTVYRISKSVRTVAGHTPWPSKCLVQVMAAKHMLRRRGIPSTVYLGLSKNEEKEMIAHAWIRSGDVFLTSVKGMKKFSVVSIYGDIENDDDSNNCRMTGQRGQKL